MATALAALAADVIPRAGRPAPQPQQGPIALIVEQFLEHVRGGGRSTATYDAYRRPLRTLFVPYAEQRGAESARDLTRELVADFAREVNGLTNVYNGKPLSPATIRTYLKSVQQLLSWLKQHRDADVHPSRVPLPVVRKVHREVLNRQEIQGLEDAAQLERDKLIIRLMGDYGLREGEVVSIRLGDLIVKERRTFLKVRGKTGERVVPIPDRRLFGRLQDYASKGRPAGARTDRLFLAMRRRRGEWEPLTTTGVYRLFESASERMNFPRRNYPHLMRHSAISHMVTGLRMNPLEVAQITGASLEIVYQHYWHARDEEIFDKLSQALERD